ncbi:hypothetical protein TWF718_005125 [Orbilia javanica]|uniref:Uncharacterized protein n=1 Tax=Orbilia javanica TaxID=47235 RepID=A0AAN8MYI7_9PEZI
MSPFNRIVEAISLINGCLDMAIKLNQVLQNWNVFHEANNQVTYSLPLKLAESIPNAPQRLGLVARVIGGGRQFVRTILETAWMGIQRPFRVFTP